jgi:hypothetical protein
MIRIAECPASFAPHGTVLGNWQEVPVSFMLDPPYIGGWLPHLGRFHRPCHSCKLRAGHSAFSGVLLLQSLINTLADAWPKHRGAAATYAVLNTHLYQMTKSKLWYTDSSRFPAGPIVQLVSLRREAGQRSKVTSC